MKRLLPRRRTMLTAGGVLIALALLLLLLPSSGLADALSNIAPASPVSPGGWMGRYPISRYQIDEFFPAVSVSLFSGISVSGVAPMIAYCAAQVIWLISAFISNTLITVFEFAFNLNLLEGEGTGGTGALAPVAQAIHSIYASTFGEPWLIGAISLVGVWAMWKALVQRRYAQTTAALAASAAYLVLAIAIVAQPQRTISPVSRISNEMSQAFLSLTNTGKVTTGAEAASQSTGQLFQTLVLDPWSVLEFGGIEHCVTSGGEAPVQPLSRDSAQAGRLARELEDGTQVHAEGKTCIDNRNKYAPHFLAYPFGSAGRNAEYEALKAGEDSKLPSSDPAKSNGSYPLSKADQPAASAAGQGGQYERLLLSILILAAETGVWLLLGSLCAGVILAQILLLLLLAFAPVCLVASVIPGRGHALFTNWLGRIAGYLARKAVYSLILAILLAVCQALQNATSSLGWLMSFLLQTAFCWAVFLGRHRLSTDLLHATAGPSAGRDQKASRLQSLLDASLLLQLAGLHRRNHTGQVPPATPAGGTTPTATTASSTPQPHPAGVPGENQESAP